MSWDMYTIITSVTILISKKNIVKDSVYGLVRTWYKYCKIIQIFSNVSGDWQIQGNR